VNHSNGDSKRKKEAKFGGYLRGLVKAHWGSQKNAATDLCVSESALSYVLTGERHASDDLLLKISDECGVPLEEIIRNKYWPQLPLFLLTAIINPVELPKAIEDYLEELENKLEEEDKRELTRYAALLLLRRHVMGNR